MAAAVCIIIILGAITDQCEFCMQIVLSLSMDKNTPKTWSVPCNFYRRIKRISSKSWQILIRSVAIFTLFVTGLCLQKYTFTFDVIGYMNEKYIINILK